MEEQAQNLIDATTAAFKAGKIPAGGEFRVPRVHFTFACLQILVCKRDKTCSFE